MDNNEKFSPEAKDFYLNIDKDVFAYNKKEYTSPSKELGIKFLNMGLNTEILFRLQGINVVIELYAIKNGEKYKVSSNNGIFIDYVLVKDKCFFLTSNYNIIIEILKKYNINTEKEINYSQYITLLHEISKEKIMYVDLVQSQISEEKIHFKSFEITGLKADLFPYQSIGCNWLKFMNDNKCGAILGDEMGLGKTLQVIALFGVIHEKNKNAKFLVVCPVSLIENWKREINKFYPSLKVLTHQGSRRSGDYRYFSNYDVVVISYSNVGTDLSMLNMINWDIVAIDEAQNIKNPYAARTKNVKMIKRKVGIAITGTPFENHITDIWSISDFAIPNYFGKISEFESLYEDNISSANEIEKILTPIMIRRRVKDVAKDLPDRVDIPQPIMMTDSEASLYEEERKQELKNALMNTSIDKIQGLRMFCTHPIVYNKNLNDTDPILLSNKYARMCEIIEEIIDNKEKVIVFTSFNKMIDIICNDIPKRFGVKTTFINGTIEPKDRQSIIDDFSQNDDSAVLVLNPKAAGAGLNITAANHVIHYNLEWNPAVEDQASARAYRRGQEKKVFVYRLYYSNTIEEVINDRIQTKRDFSDTAIIGNKGTNKDKEDLLRALNISPIGGEK